MAERKNVRVMPSGTTDPSGQWRKVNIRGKPWPHTPSWVLVTDADYASDLHRQIETVVDSGGWLPGLEEAHIAGYVPGGWTIPLAIVLDFKMAKYSVNGTQYPLNQILDPLSRWGTIPPAALVPGVGLTSPAAPCRFAFVPTLAHILVYLGMDCKTNYANTALGDLSLAFTDDNLNTFAIADGSDMATDSCRYTGPAGNVVVHRSPAPTAGTHRFDCTMTTVTGRIRTDMAQWTELIHAVAGPEPMAVVARVGGPITVTRMTLSSLPQGATQLPTLPINLPDETEPGAPEPEDTP